MLPMQAESLLDMPADELATLKEDAAREEEYNQVRGLVQHKNMASDWHASCQGLCGTTL